MKQYGISIQGSHYRVIVNSSKTAVGLFDFPFKAHCDLILDINDNQYIKHRNFSTNIIKDNLLYKNCQIFEINAIKLKHKIPRYDIQILNRFEENDYIMECYFYRFHFPDIKFIQILIKKNSKFIEHIKLCDIYKYIKINSMIEKFIFTII